MRRAIRICRLFGEGLTGRDGCRRLPHTPHRPKDHTMRTIRILLAAIVLVAYGYYLPAFIQEPVEIGSAVSIDRIECSEGTTP
jgi:hypothetical protein